MHAPKLKINKQDGHITNDELNQHYGDKSMFFKYEQDALEYKSKYKKAFPYRPAYIYRIKDACSFEDITSELAKATDKKTFKPTKFKYIGWLVSTPDGKIKL